MNLSEISIKNPVFAWMLMSFLIIFGGISFARLGVSELPDVDFPVLTIRATLEGAAPEVIELDVIDPIEDALMTIQGVQSISSTARQGSASIVVEFGLDRDIDVALQDVQARLSQAQRQLPKDLDPPTIVKANPEDQPIMWLSVSLASGDLRELSNYVRTKLKDDFARLPGVAEVFLGGFVDPTVRVDIDGKKLGQYAMTAKDVIGAIQAEHVETPGGQFVENLKELSVRTLGEASSLEDIRRIRINTRGGAPNFNPLRIEQVASVEKGLSEVRRVSRTDGHLSIGLGIRKQRGTNAIAVANEVRAKLKALETSLPPGYSIGVNFDGTAFIREAVGELNLTLVLAAILTSLVCLLFLGSLASTFNIILAIPTSIVGTFMVLYFAGFTLNTFTLLALTISIGIVVDDAIMMLENIQRHYEMGKSKVQAALDGAKEISFAALVATVAIIAIFLPVIFMDGIIGKFLFEFGVTVSVAVALSLVEALTLTPMRCSQFLETEHRKSHFGKRVDEVFDGFRSQYARSIEWALDHRWMVILGSFIFFGLTVMSVKFLPKELAPSQDQSRFLIRIETPIGSSLDFTDQKFKILEDFLSKRPEVERYFAAVGGFGGGEVNSGIIFVTMKPIGSRGRDPVKNKELDQQGLMEVCRQEFNKIPDVSAKIQDLSARGFAAGGRGFPVEFTIRGPDWKQLGILSGQIMEKMKETNLMSDVDSNYEVGAPEFQVIPDRESAAQRGVSIATIGETVKALTTGVIAGRFPEGGRRYDIRVQVDPTEKDYRKSIENLFVRNNRGELVPLKSVVKFQDGLTLSQVFRQDRERSIQIFANIAPGKSQDLAIQSSEQIARQTLPDGYHLVLGGSSKSLREGFASLGFALLLGILISYMVLASQFNSFIHPITVLMALPFSVSGAFLALLVTGQSLNLYSFIGLLLLMGIVKKNSILLVDYTNLMRSEGKNVREAILKACPVRLRPILMTSFATVAGAIPGALALGPGSETRIPLSVAIIGGVLVSTLLTLFVVPCAYSVLVREKKY